MFTLVLYIYAGIFSKGDNVALTNVPGFKTEASCQAAGHAATPLVHDSKKEIRFVCLKSDS